MLAAGPDLHHLVGPLFWWKLALALFILTAAVFIYRPFCRVLCPLGAFLGLFNRVALFRLTASRACSSCGSCAGACPVGLALPARRNSMECIRCLECVKSCPRRALTFSRRGA